MESTRKREKIKKKNEEKKERINSINFIYRERERFGFLILIVINFFYGLFSRSFFDLSIYF